jgi:GTP-sensing pleiotropic transcriptional regulator CodY
MSEKKQAPKVEDYTNVVKETTGLVRKNYLNSIKLPLSLWEENLKVVSTQFEQWHKFQEDYINAVIEFYERFPSWNVNSKVTNGHFEHLVAFQKNYVSLVIDASNRLTKGTLNIVQKNVEQTSSLLDSYLSLFRA